MNCTIYCRKALAALLCCASLAACQKEYAIIDELGLLQHTLKVSCDPGYTNITVYADSDWSLSLEKETEWASLNKTSGSGFGDFRLSWAANFGVSRDLRILIKTDAKKDTIHVIQAGAITSPYMNLATSRVMLPSASRSFDIAMTTNLEFCLDEFKARAIYDGKDTLEVGSTDSRAWIESFSIEKEKVQFTASQNTLGAGRTADIVFYMKDADGIETRAVVTVLQSATGPAFSSPGAQQLYANADTYEVLSADNNIWSLPEATITADVPWISALTLTEAGLLFTTEENKSGSPRSGSITVKCNGLASPVVIPVSQAAEKLLSFEELRTRIPGLINTTDKLEGIIVSDPSSPNICSSVQTGQFAFDRSENSRTAYLESIDGSYGLCLKFSSASENTFARGDRVLISLGGATLSRESSPARYTLSGLSSDKFTVLESGAAIPDKVRSISQLTDADIYTWVSLSNIEILAKDGSYTNASEGYSLADTLNPSGSASPRWDVAPLMCTDPNGDAIFMLTNAAAPWRRSTDSEHDMAFYNFLPQGAGTLSGVIVSDNVAPVRWGNLGKYQIRPMSAADIALGQEYDRFSNIICEWTFNSEEESWSADKGDGKLSLYDAATSFGQDFNNPYLPQDKDAANGGGTTNLKGLVSNCAAVFMNKWWDFDTDTGKYIDIRFNTTGLNGTNMVFGIIWGHGLGADATTISAPSNWDVLYSTDGTNFTRLTTIKQRSCAWWTTTSQDATPGFTEHLVKLPGSCFDKSNVTVRLQAASRVTDIAPATSASTWQSALGIERGTITSSTTKEQGAVRIGTITVRYN